MAVSKSRIAVAATILAIFGFLLKRKTRRTYWSKRNVKTGKLVPFFGELSGIFFGTTSNADTIIRLYKEVENVRYYGTYQFMWPLLVLKSPDLIKEMLVENSRYFMKHRNTLKENVDPLWCKNLFCLKEDEWRKMRDTLSPSFSLEKLENMLPDLHQRSSLFVKHFLEMNGDVIEVEFKDNFTRYTIDTIGKTALGIEVDSLKDRDNRFYVMGKSLGDFETPWRNFVFFSYTFFPSIANLFRISLFDKKLLSFFMNLVKTIIEERENDNTQRSDMLGLLLEKRKKCPQLTDIDIAAQVFLFYLGGVENVSTVLSFLAHELAVNSHIQKKLMEEIDRNRGESSWISYDTITTMPYLDMVVSETLRKYPVTLFTDRVVTKSYTIKPKLEGESPLSLKIGEAITIPIIAIHHDPEYFENPEKFDPERFSPENRKLMKPYSYIPFGLEPRICIAKSFAFLEIKTIFVHILSHFEIVPVERTNVPVKISKKSINLRSAEGFHLGLKRRK